MFYIAVHFKGFGSQSYTYQSTEEYANGDEVIVEANGRMSIVTVVGCTTEKPAFNCKPVLGKFIRAKA